MRTAFFVAAFISVVSLAAQTPVYTPGTLTPSQQVTRDILKELIEINTSVMTGNVTAGAVAMAKRFREAGIPDSDIFIGGPRADKHNVVARYRGKNPAGRKPLLLVAHLDVVEALKEDWSPEFDPFKFTEKDGYYYARGIADDKAMASIFVANLLRMKQEGYVPDRDIIIALTADEESGAFNGVDWLVQNHRNLIDAGIALNEGGGGTLRDGKPLFNTIQLAQKITTNYTLHDGALRGIARSLCVIASEMCHPERSEGSALRLAENRSLVSGVYPEERKRRRAPRDDEWLR
jgi:acetylornithine deacetylase/succinyl-diaminopimelate desuccinylase-like protein